MQKKAMKEEQGVLKESGYSDKAIKLYLDKVNVGVLEKPSIVARAILGSRRESCHRRCKVQCLGCPGVASSASSLTSLLKGKTIEDAKKITESGVFNELGGLPDPKIDCIVLERGTGE
jgi:hypothetical protein